jgi:hypothetical protein
VSGLFAGIFIGGKPAGITKSYDSGPIGSKTGSLSLLQAEKRRPEVITIKSTLIIAFPI